MDARTGGTQITDLTDVDDGGLHHGHVSDASGSVVFYGPTVKDRALGRVRAGDRMAVRPTDPAPIAVTGVR